MTRVTIDHTDYELDVEQLQAMGLLKPVAKDWPQEGDNYWYITSDGRVNSYSYEKGGSEGDIAFGNCFKTFEAAEKVRERRYEQITI